LQSEKGQRDTGVWFNFVDYLFHCFHFVPHRQNS
jgi:hypothetical protein